MIPLSTSLEHQALEILHTFAAHACLAQEVHISRAIGDLTAVLGSGALLIVRLRVSSDEVPLTPKRVGKTFSDDIRFLRCAQRVRAVQRELWIAKPDGSWQFFEIRKKWIREVSHGE